VNANTSPADDEILDLRKLTAKLATRPLWVIASVIVFTAVLGTYAFTKTPTYRAGTVLAPARTGQGAMTPELGNFGGLAALAGIGLEGTDGTTEEALAVLRSREFTERFIRDEKLLPKFFPDAWDASTGTWRKDVRTPTPAKAYRYFDSRVRRIIQSKKTGLTTIEVDWHDREEAAHWANELVRRLNAEMRQRATEKANTSLKFLERELEGTRIVEVRESINNLIEAQIKQRMLASVNEEFTFRVVDKAVAPDADEPVSPNKLALLAAGPVLGVLFGIALIFFVDFVKDILAARRARAR
jgi:uncharacterized protein involved in exopolysaccharide biosynthesis